MVIELYILRLNRRIYLQPKKTSYVIRSKTLFGYEVLEVEKAFAIQSTETASNSVVLLLFIARAEALDLSYTFFI